MRDLRCICDLDPIEYMQGQKNHQNVEKQAFNIVHTQTLSLHFLLHYKIIHRKGKKIFAHFEHVAYNCFKC